MHCESILKTSSHYLDAKSKRIRSNGNTLCQQIKALRPFYSVQRASQTCARRKQSDEKRYAAYIIRSVCRQIT